MVPAIRGRSVEAWESHRKGVLDRKLRQVRLITSPVINELVKDIRDNFAGGQKATVVHAALSLQETNGLMKIGKELGSVFVMFHRCYQP